MTVNDQVELNWDLLVETGALVQDSPDGEWTFDLAVLKLTNPDLYRQHITEVRDQLTDLISEGIVTPVLDAAGVTYSLTPKGEQLADDILFAITQT